MTLRQILVLSFSAILILGIGASCKTRSGVGIGVHTDAGPVLEPISEAHKSV